MDTWLHHINCFSTNTRKGISVRNGSDAKYVFGDLVTSVQRHMSHAFATENCVRVEMYIVCMYLCVHVYVF